MSGISKFRSSATTNRNQGGGNKLSGLPPSVGGNSYARNAWQQRASGSQKARHTIFYMNQIGGIGSGKSMFGSSADGVRKSSK